MAAALAVFLVVAQPTGGSVKPTVSQWVVFLVATVLLVLVLMALGKRLPTTARAAVIALAAGILAATYAVVIKGVFDSTGAARLVFILLTLISAVTYPLVSAEAFKTGAVTVSSSVMILVPSRFSEKVDDEKPAATDADGCPEGLLNANSILCVLAFFFTGYSFLAYAAQYSLFLREALGYSVVDAGTAYIICPGILLAQVGEFAIIEQGDLLVACDLTAEAP